MLKMFVSEIGEYVQKCDAKPAKDTYISLL